MSHFAGYLTYDRQARNPQAESQTLTAMARSPGLKVSVHQTAHFWVACQTVPLWRDDDGLTDTEGCISVIAGDPQCPAALPDSPAAGDAALRDDMVLGATRRLATCTGTFCAAAWNPTTRTLLLATDWVGSRSLYYCVEAGRLSFATSLRLLRRLRASPEAVDEQGLAESVFFGQALGHRTQFQGVHVLRPGQFLRLGTRLKPELGPYVDIAAQPLTRLEPDEVVARLHERFAAAVRRRLRPGPQEAFLSGGMDSRAVVAALVDAGQSVRSFCTAYPGSLDDLVSRDVAGKLGTDHQVRHRTPADRVRVAMDPFAQYARQHFPPQVPMPKGRMLWSGDGGSVTLGHVYLTPAAVSLAAGPLDQATVRKLLPNLDRRPTRQVDAARLRRWADLATQGALNELLALDNTAPERRLFQFYMRNDQARHLHHHFDDIDLNQIELLTPFFDGEFVALVSALPIGAFLRHGIYNRWIRGFACGAGEIYWQTYRGHEPCPHPPPKAPADQWDQSWYSGPDVRRTYRDIAAGLLRADDSLASAFVSRGWLRLARLASLAGSSRLDYEIAYARNLLGLYASATLPR